MWKTWTTTKNDLNIRFACLTFYLLFSSLLAQIAIDLPPESVFSVLLPLFSTSICCMLSNTSLTHSCFKHPAFFSSQATSVLIPRLLVWYSKNRVSKDRLFWVSCFKPYVFNLFLSHWRPCMYFSRTSPSSLGGLLFVHVLDCNQMFWPILRAASGVRSLYPGFTIPSCIQPKFLQDKDCMTMKHWHTVHARGTSTIIQGLWNHSSLLFHFCFAACVHLLIGCHKCPHFSGFSPNSPLW